MFNQTCPTHAAAASVLEDLSESLHTPLNPICDTQELSIAANHGSAYLTGKAEESFVAALEESGSTRRYLILDVMRLLALAIVADELADAADVDFDDEPPPCAHQFVPEAGVVELIAALRNQGHTVIRLA